MVPAVPQHDRKGVERPAYSGQLNGRPVRVTITDPVPPQVLFTFAQAAAMTALPESWLRKAVANRTIAHRRVGKHVRFSQADIADLVSNAETQPAPRLRKATA